MTRRRGRPKKENVIRFPSGDVKEEPLDAPFNMIGIAEKEVAHEGKLLHLRKRVPELERLYDEGYIREHQKIAGERYIDLVTRYRRAIEARDGPKHSSPAGYTGGTTRGWDLLTDGEQEALISIEDKYDALFVQILKHPVKCKRALDAVCLDNLQVDRIDRDHTNRTELDWFRVATDEVADFYGLETRKRA
jgi:hypothetical protein